MISQAGGGWNQQLKWLLGCFLFLISIGLGIIGSFTFLKWASLLAFRVFLAEVKFSSQTIFQRPEPCNFNILAGGAVAFVNTSASCRSEFTHLVFKPVALICCFVAITSIDVRFSEPPKPNPSDSFFSKASYKLLQSVIAIASGRSFNTSSGLRRSMPWG